MTPATSTYGCPCGVVPPIRVSAPPLRCSADNEMDTLTPNEGSQRYEKSEPRLWASAAGAEGDNDLPIAPPPPLPASPVISGMYLGELTRLLLLDLHSEGAVFVPSAAPPVLIAAAASSDPAAAAAAEPVTPRAPGLSRHLVTPWALDTRLLSDISADTSAGLDVVGATLRDELGMPRSSLEDRRVVQEVAVRHHWLQQPWGGEGDVGGVCVRAPLPD